MLSPEEEASTRRVVGRKNGEQRVARFGARSWFNIYREIWRPQEQLGNAREVRSLVSQRKSFQMGRMSQRSLVGVEVSPRLGESGRAQRGLAAGVGPGVAALEGSESWLQVRAKSD